MTRGFTDVTEFEPVIGWELYQVTLDKYHVMFWFKNGHALLNIADSFSYRSKDGRINFTYKTEYVDGRSNEQTWLNLSRILRMPVSDIEIVSTRDLALRFENGDLLTVHDNPSTRSWWFCEYELDQTIPANKPLRWHASDIESDEDI